MRTKTANLFRSLKQTASYNGKSKTALDSMNIYLQKQTTNPSNQFASIEAVQSTDLARIFSLDKSSPGQNRREYLEVDLRDCVCTSLDFLIKFINLHKNV